MNLEEHLIAPMDEYPKVVSIGKSEREHFESAYVVIQAKIDGSNVAFTLTEDKTLLFRSRKISIPGLGHAGGYFDALIESITKIKGKLRPGLVYRGEYLRQPRHNRVAYDRVPPNNFVLFDVQDADGNYLDTEKALGRGWMLGSVSCRYYTGAMGVFL